LRSEINIAEKRRQAKMTLDVGGVARGLLTWEKQEHLVKLAILILAAVLCEYIFCFWQYASGRA